MNWEAIGAAGEIVGAIAVVISLVFLAFQLRSNTGALKASAYQAIHDAEDRFWQDISCDPKLTDLWAMALDGLELMTEEEKRRSEIVLLRWIGLFQNVHYQRQRGFVGSEIWPTWHSTWVLMLRYNKGVRQMYEQMVSFYSPEFVEYSKDCIEEGLKMKDEAAPIVLQPTNI